MDAIELLIEDHRTVKDLFGRFDRSVRSQTLRRLADQIVRELSVHAAIEEAKLYPIVRKELDGGEFLYTKSREEHQQMDVILADLDEGLEEAHTPAFAAHIASLRREVERHVEEEERRIFPLLRRAISETRLDRLGMELKRAKAVAPTRPRRHQSEVRMVTEKRSSEADKGRDLVKGD
ncbi:MAG: cation-binding protein [Candidatus Aeolococcus gillhamiae]|uniref:Cation-binding protein n=1 Tax=Candidatus Aeolococcus gillhamiae TaxID=3127015 RepID=A0A2W5Z2W9_9BACT|nr:MAG: cation-binding protein [Candidatus Dormibacter sp. RRmetagenome_bin12]